MPVCVLCISMLYHRWSATEQTVGMFITEQSSPVTLQQPTVVRY